LVAVLTAAEPDIAGLRGSVSVDQGDLRQQFQECPLVFRVGRGSPGADREHRWTGRRTRSQFLDERTGVRVADHVIMPTFSALRYLEHRARLESRFVIEDHGQPVEECRERCPHARGVHQGRDGEPGLPFVTQLGLYFADDSWSDPFIDTT
jgi:hypothetical protein